MKLFYRLTVCSQIGHQHFMTRGYYPEDAEDEIECEKICRCGKVYLKYRNKLSIRGMKFRKLLSKLNEEEYEH